MLRTVTRMRSYGSHVNVTTQWSRIYCSAHLVLTNSIISLIKEFTTHSNSPPLSHSSRHPYCESPTPIFLFLVRWQTDSISLELLYLHLLLIITIHYYWTPTVPRYYHCTTVAEWMDCIITELLGWMNVLKHHIRQSVMRPVTCREIDVSQRD